jgi:hypothetical protein
MKYLCNIYVSPVSPILSGLSLFMLNDLPHKTFWPWFNLAAS